MTRSERALRGFSPYLKLGSNKEKKIFDYAAGRETYEGVVVSAMMLEGYFERTSTFLKGLGKKYFIDPSTHVFQQRPEALKSKEGKVKASYRSMIQTYGSPVAELAGTRSLTAQDFLAKPELIDEFTRRVIDYQRHRVKGGATLFDDVEDFMSLGGAAVPSILVAPYFHFTSTSDPWYGVTLRCAKAAMAYAKASERVWPVLLLSPRILTELALLSKISADFDSIGSPGFILWVNDFRDEKQSLVRLKGLSQLVSELSSQGKPVLRLYGGAFSFLLSERGLSGFSSGPGYGSSKNAFAYSRKGGPTIPSFYIEQLRAVYQLDETEAILRRHKELICDCEVCKGTYGRNLDHFKQIGEAGRYQSHFLNIRSREIATLRSSDGLSSLISQMQDTITSLAGVNTQHLSAWLGAAGHSVGSSKPS